MIGVSEQPPSTEVTIFRQAVERRWLIMGSTALFLLLGFVYALLQPPRYESSATLVIQQPGAIGALTGADIRPDRYVADQSAILSSDAVAERAIEILRIDFPDVPSLDDVRSSRRVDSDSESNVILISYVADDPELSQSGANALVVAYREAVREEATQTFDNALATVDAALFEVEEALAELEPVDTPVTITTLPAGLTSDYEDALERLSELRRLRESAAPEDLDALRAELADLLTFLDAVRVVTALEAAPTEDALSDSDRDRLETYRDELIGIRNSVALDAEFAGSSSTIFSAAGPGEEVSGTPLQILAIAGVLGLMFGLGLLLVLPAATPIFESAEEVAEALGTTVLADVPELAAVDVLLAVVDSPNSEAASVFKKAATTLHARLDLVRTGLGEPPKQPLKRDEKGRFMKPEHTPSFGAGKSVVVVSAGPKEGRSSVVANLAAAAATQSRRILAVDADFDNPRLTELLQGKSGPGLTNIVQQEMAVDEAIQVVQLGADIELSLIGKGSIMAAPLDFFRSGKAREFFKETVEDYDLVFVDTPALYVAPYAAAIARYCDEVVVVVPHRSLVEDIAGLAEQLKLISSNLAGVVYNRPQLVQ